MALRRRLYGRVKFRHWTVQGNGFPFLPSDVQHIAPWGPVNRNRREAGEVGGWRLEVGGWRLEVGGWRLEVGGEAGGWRRCPTSQVIRAANE